MTTPLLLWGNSAVLALAAAILASRLPGRIDHPTLALQFHRKGYGA